MPRVAIVTAEFSPAEAPHVDRARSFWAWFVQRERSFRGKKWVEAIYSELSKRWPEIGVELEAPKANRTTWTGVASDTRARSAR